MIFVYISFIILSAWITPIDWGDCGASNHLTWYFLVTSRRWWQKNATYRNNEWAIVWAIFIWVTRTYVMFCFSYFVCLSFFVTTIVAWLFFYVSVGGWINNSKCWFNHLESTLVHPFAEASMFHKICWLTCPISNPGPFHSFELSVL